MPSSQLSGMIDLITTIALTVGSVVLFLYWFRYSCLLILNAEKANEYACALASTHGLHFVEVQSRLAASQPAELDKLRGALDRDYAVIQRLLSGVEQESRLQNWMLGLYYQAAQSTFKLSRSLSPRAARQALEQMETVVAYFANVAGEAAAAA
jgi:hypothetical protein